MSKIQDIGTTGKNRRERDSRKKYKEEWEEREHKKTNGRTGGKETERNKRNQYIIGKGPNGTLSLIFDGIKKLNKGEKHLKITCDNAGGQNKNNTSIWFYLYLVICGYYESIELNFMIPGHTKFKCDGSFGLIKKLYRKTTVDCVNHVVEMVNKSSSTGLNKTQCYKNGKGFQYLDFKSVLENFFKKLNGLQKYQHFLFEAANPGIVKVQMVANSAYVEFNLLKASIFEITNKIKTLSLLMLTPLPLDYKRQEYLYQNIRPFVKDEFKDITCPKPVRTVNDIF